MLSFEILHMGVPLNTFIPPIPIMVSYRYSNVFCTVPVLYGYYGRPFGPFSCNVVTSLLLRVIVINHPFNFS